MTIKLDYSLKTPEERIELVNKILAEAPRVNERYLEILSDYIISCAGKEAIKNKEILSENRLVTITKRETSFEGLVSQFENGEDGIYDLINDNKNELFKPKIAITEEDVEQIPELQAGLEAIEFWENRLKTATGKDAYVAKKAIIDLRKDQYIIKDAYRCPAQSRNTHGGKRSQLWGYVTVDKEGNCTPHGVSFLNPKVISGILCNYEGLNDARNSAQPDSDIWCLMTDFDELLKRSLADQPIYETIVWGKIEGKQNVDIQKLLMKKHNISYSAVHISSLWRNKIPELIAEFAEEEYLNWYFTFKEKGKYKKCNRCGKVKLAHSKYFTKNKTSKDGWYSICKECRNKKGK